MNVDAQSTFRALSDPTRRDILQILSNGDMTIGKIAEQFDFSRTAVKKHLTILEEGNLITVAVNGRERINHLNINGLHPIMEWISFFDRFWDSRLSGLKTTIEKELN